MAKRVLGAIRLSNDTDATTSPERQREQITDWAQKQSHIIVGWAEDLDVSGAVAPANRPQLGPWLSDAKLTEWDIIAVAKIDRISRRLVHFANFIEWLDTKGKGIASATEPIDTSDPFGRMIAHFLALFADFERQYIAERVAGSRRKLREQAKYPGGQVPYGLIPSPAPDGKGFVLVHDDEAIQVIRELVEGVLSGKSQQSLCEKFQLAGIPTPRDRWEVIKGREPKGHIWGISATSKLLRSRHLLGEQVHQSEVIHISEPILAEQKWAALQTALDKRSQERFRSETPSMLLRVAFCAGCGEPLYRQTNRHRKTPQHYLKCRARQTKIKTCPQSALPALKVEATVSKLVLSHIGRREVGHWVDLPAQDHTESISKTTRLMEELEDEKYTGGFQGREERYVTLKDRLQTEHQRLSALPTSPGGRQWVGTGQTYRESWPTMDVQDRRKLLMDGGIRVFIGRGEMKAAQQAWSDHFTTGGGGGTHLLPVHIHLPEVHVYVLWP